MENIAFDQHIAELSKIHSKLIRGKRISKAQQQLAAICVAERESLLRREYSPATQARLRKEAGVR